METAAELTLDNTSSSSSEETVASKPWLETARLGQKIVHELGLDHTNNLLSRWMAHRVAELIELGETGATKEEREVARRECADLILQLWERRMDWPVGGPLTHILPMLREIAPEPDHYRMWNSRRSKTGGTWAGLFSVLVELEQEESKACMAGIFSDASKESAEHSRSWLQEHPDELPDDERKILETYLGWVDYVAGEDFHLNGQALPHFSALPPEERTARLKAVLSAVAEERQKAIETVQSQDEPLRAVEPKPMHGNIASDEEQHAEHFALLHQQIHFAEEDEDDTNEANLSDQSYE